MKVVDDLIPRPLLYLGIGLLVLGFVRGGGAAAAVTQLTVGAQSMVRPLEALAVTVGLLALVAGVILHYVAPHKRIQAHGRGLIGAAFAGALVLGVGIALLPHIPDLGGRLGDASYRALVSALP